MSGYIDEPGLQGMGEMVVIVWAQSSEGKYLEAETGPIAFIVVEFSQQDVDTEVSFGLLEWRL